MTDVAALARAIIDANLYMVLCTADASGRPWVSPVYFAPEDYRAFYWVSAPDAQHSQNIAARPDVSIAIFDSQAPIDTGNGVYLTGTAEQVDSPEHGVGVFSARSLGHGGQAWTVDDVVAPARLRLYRTTAASVAVLDPDAPTAVRVSVEL